MWIVTGIVGIIVAILHDYAEGGATRHTVIVLSVSHSVFYTISTAHAKR